MHYTTHSELIATPQVETGAPPCLEMHFTTHSELVATPQVETGTPPFLGEGPAQDRDADAVRKPTMQLSGRTADEFAAGDAGARRRGLTW